MTLTLFIVALEVPWLYPGWGSCCSHRLAVLKCHLPAVLPVLGMEWATSVLEARACPVQGAFVEVGKCGGRGVLSASSLREQAGSYGPGEGGRQARADGPLLAEDGGG